MNSTNTYHLTPSHLSIGQYGANKDELIASQIADDISEHFIEMVREQFEKAKKEYEEKVAK